MLTASLIIIIFFFIIIITTINVTPSSCLASDLLPPGTSSNLSFFLSETHSRELTL